MKDSYDIFKNLKFSSNILGFICVILFLLVTKYRYEYLFYIPLVILCIITLLICLYLFYILFKNLNNKKVNNTKTILELCLRILIPILIFFYFHHN